MEPQSQSPARLAFGPFEVNVAAGQLAKSGVRIRLSGQPFQILLTLLAHPGEVVTNQELREQIWKEGTFVDFEHGLHAAVNKLRRSLGDSAENPRYIETVPGAGISLSPDGKTAAHVATDKGKAALWVRPLEALPPGCSPEPRRGMAILVPGQQIHRVPRAR